MPAPNNRMCQVETCDRRHWANNYCQKHDRQVREHGHILTGNYLSEQGKKARAASSGNKGKHWKLDDDKKRYGFVPKSAFKKGHKPANTGKHDWMTPEHKEALRQANIGNTRSRGRKRPDMVGAKNHMWKGGVKSQNDKDRVRFRKFFQQLVFQRDNYTCQICDAYGVSIQVDHIKKWSEYPELRFDIDNCRTLCMACHYYVTFKRKMPKGIVWGHNLKRRIG